MNSVRGVHVYALKHIYYIFSYKPFRSDSLGAAQKLKIKVDD